MQFNDRLKQVRLENGLKQIEFADAIGVKQKTVSNWEQGRNEPNIAALESISRKWAVDLSWLLTGDGGMHRETALAVSEQPAEYQVSVDSDYVTVPQYDIQASAGFGLLVNAEDIVDYIAFKKDWLAKLWLDKNNICLIEAKGDSMEPVIKNGDLLLLDTSGNDFEEGIFVINLHGQLLVKRIQKKLDGTVIIKSDNPVYEPEILKPNQEHDIKIIGKVVWNGRQIG